MVYVEVLLTLQHSDYWIFFFFNLNQTLICVKCGLEGWKSIHSAIFLHLCSIYHTSQTRCFWTVSGGGETGEMDEMDGENQRAKSWTLTFIFGTTLFWFSISSNFVLSLLLTNSLQIFNGILNSIFIYRF